jgi:hypothetical protein
VRYFACEVNRPSANAYVQLIRGRLGVTWHTPVTPRPPFTQFSAFPVGDVPEATPSWAEALLWQGAIRPGQPSWEFWAPLWLLGLAVGLPSVLAWVAHRRAPRTGCHTCNYDLSGLPPGSPCPECAAKPSNHC